MSAANSQSGTAERIAALTTAELRQLARFDSADAQLAVDSWRCEEVSGGFGGMAGGTAIFRFVLQTNAGSRSLILKVLNERPGESPRSPYYWKREYELYKSGMLADLPAETFIAPRVLRLRDFGDACWIWMTDYDERKQGWLLEDYREVALRLGRMNGAWLGRDLPQQVWLADNWHSAIAPGLEAAFDKLETDLELPLSRLTLPHDAYDEVMGLWRDRQLFMDALAQLPRTFNHNDAFIRNILHSEDGVVLLDWALAGRGALGEELVCLVSVSLYYSGYTREYAEQLDEQVFSGYMQGLREAGWTGDEGLPRLGYLCGMTLRGLAGVKQDIEYFQNPSQYERFMDDWSLENLKYIAEYMAAVRQFRLLRCGREARRLLKG